MKAELEGKMNYKIVKRTNEKRTNEKRTEKDSGQTRDGRIDINRGIYLTRILNCNSLISFN